MKTSKKQKSEAEIAWRTARQDERWEIRADYLMFNVFNKVSVMLPSQITHLKNQPEAQH